MTSVASRVGKVEISEHPAQDASVDQAKIVELKTRMSNLR